MANLENKNVPLHVGLIMDGNRRWAKRRLLSAVSGHSAGMDRMVELAEHAKLLGVRYMTVYALSTENLNRSREELNKMFDLLRKNFSPSVKRLLAQGAAVKVIGDLSLLPSDVCALIEDELKNSPDSAGFTFIMALGYGARDEIVKAVNAAVKAGKTVDGASFERYLYTAGVPDPDLIIRTGGELRLSNFLLWQAAYAELYFSDVLFPDFTCEEFDKAIEDFGGRKRRFGRE